MLAADVRQGVAQGVVVGHAALAAVEAPSLRQRAGGDVEGMLGVVKKFDGIVQQLEQPRFDGDGGVAARRLICETSLWSR